jgi:hypothetical protein
MATTYPNQWSTVVVYYRDGAPPTTINMSAGVTIAKHLMQEMRDYGFCSIRNDVECVIVAAAEVSRIEIRQIAHGEAPRA